jgi:predicted ATP-grasp superfamily ATP-dependent carboligase
VAGVPIPSIHYPESIEDVRQVAPDLSYPCILKPYDSHTSRAKLNNKKVIVVHSAADLLDTYEKVFRLEVPVMIQDIIPGEDSALFGYLAFWDGDGNERAWLTKQKLRQYPPGFGDGSLQTTVEVPKVAELSRQLLRAFDYRGFVGVEFKYDARDDTYRLMEINPRTVSGNQLAITAGVDFPWIAYQYLVTGVEPDNGLQFRRNVKYVNEEWDVLAYLALRRSGQISLKGWIESLRGVEASAIWALDDSRPLIVGFGRFLSHLIRGR